MTKGYLIDMDGVIYRGSTMIPGAMEFIKQLPRLGAPFLFLTNNSERSPKDLVPGGLLVKSKMEELALRNCGNRSLKKHELCGRIQFMPELSRFFGIIIRMYMEAGVQHHTPHFHAYYQEQVAVYGINSIELISGSLPKRQQRMVEAWVELHQQELLEDWERLQAGQAPRPIAPLA